MSEHIRALPAPGGAAALGGKGASLSRLMELGLPVPAAFVVGPGACRAHAARLPPAPGDDALAQALEAHRQALCAAPLDAALVAELEAALETLGPGSYAVRSSALAEDGATHSFAGQHDTLLGVERAGVADAVRRCWASLWSERAARYRASVGLGGAPEMAVVVQRLVPAEAAGVLFTCDPVRRRADRVVVEAVRGLGEALVSGRATPERWVLARPGLALLEHDAPGVPALTEAQARALAELGLKVEQSAGAPQDIEWALAQGQLHLLQARPVTTPPVGPLYVWSNTNTGELLPDVATPMTFSVIDGYVRALLSRVLGPVGIDLSRHPIVGLVGGRVYFCLNTFLAMMRAVPGMGRRNPAELFGGDVAQMSAALARLEPGDLPAVELHPGRMVAGSLRTLAVLWRHRHVEGQALLESARAWTRELASVELGALSDEALAEHVAKLQRDPFGEGDGLVATGAGLAAANGLAALCRLRLGDVDGAICGRLLSALGDLDSAEAGRAMWRLSLPARAPEVAEALGSPGDWRERLAASDAGRIFLAALDGFLAQHGHHARGELDLAVPRWREEPEGVLASVRAFLARPEAATPEQVQARVAAERQALETDCRRRLGPMSRWLFGVLLARARRGFALRENLKSEVVRCLALLRAALLEAGRRLQARGALAEPGEVFFLSLEELLAALRGRTEGVAGRVVRRRAEHARNQQLRPPALVVGEYDGAPEAESAVPGGDRLSGIAVSPGVAEGRARVILRADATERVEPGEILVAPFTDPGWTPYFVAASAVVVDLGGMLSHGSIVAREYGIPAVVNVGQGTRRIRTGQRLRVDGNRGLVTLLEG